MQVYSKRRPRIYKRFFLRLYICVFYTNMKTIFHEGHHLQGKCRKVCRSSTNWYRQNNGSVVYVMVWLVSGCLVSMLKALSSRIYQGCLHQSIVFSKHCLLETIYKRDDRKKHKLRRRVLPQRRQRKRKMGPTPRQRKRKMGPTPRLRLPPRPMVYIMWCGWYQVVFYKHIKSVSACLL